MKIILPNGEKIDLVNSLTFEEKVLEVEKKIEEFKYQIETGWETNSVRYFLDSLSNYLVWHKEEEMRNKEDKEIMSRGKLNSMHRGSEKSRLFADLQENDKALLGLDDKDG